MSCRPLSQFQFHSEDWDGIARAFENSATCELRQSWRKHLHPRFLPARVFLAWTPQALWLYAELNDLDIFNTATQLNQQTFLLGDVFEIFLHPLPGEEYFELHVTPHNQKLQLHFSGGSKVSKDQALISAPDFFRSRVLIEAPQQRWRVLTEIPALNLIGKNLEEGDQWLFSFSRYDYSHGHEKPILSSTSLHSRPNFHDRHDWDQLTFTS